MSTDLTMLVWSVILTLVLMLIAVSGATLTVGLPKLAGNREDIPPGDCPGWVGRAQRLHRNMLENLPLFAVLVLVATVAGKSDDITALGAQIFFWARIVHAVIYLVGLPWVRTPAWAVSVVGMVMILSRLV